MLTSLMAKIKHRYDRLIVPCAGQFCLVRGAIAAGFDPKQAECSDISVFSAVLGCWYAGRPIDELPIKLDEEHELAYRKFKREVAKAAYLLWLMRVRQLKSNKMYLTQYRQYFIDKRDMCLASLCTQLEEQKEKLGGMKYEMADIRDVVRAEYDERTLVLVHPPAYRKGYTKMFDFEPELTWGFTAPEMDFDDEFGNLYLESKKSPATYIWARYNLKDDLPEEDLFWGLQFSPVSYSYCMITKPEVLKDAPEFDGIAWQRPWKESERLPLPIISEDYEIRPDSKVSFIGKGVDHNVASYYRDLWAHKLGATLAEHYFVMLIDGQIFGIVGLHTGHLRRMEEGSEYVFETYGFNAPMKKYPTANRLLMMAITCQEFLKGQIMRHALKTNRIFEIQGFRTTCLSRYRKVKLNNGLLDVVKREKMKNGLYKIMYECKFYDRTYADCVQLFLRELQERENARAETEQAG